MNRPSCQSSPSRMILTLIVVLAAPPGASAQTYRIRELPPLPGDPFSLGGGINDAGVAVGQSGIADSTAVAVRWIDSVPESLGTLTGLPASVAVDISGDGSRIVGLGYTPNTGGLPLGLGRPFVWQDGVLTELPLPGGRAAGEPSRIKATGETIVGAAYDWNATDEYHNDVPCRWDWDEATGSWQVTALQTLGAATGGYAVSINSAGDIFGYSRVAAGAWRACRWDPGSSAPVDLGVGDGSVSGGGNDVGHAVGWTSSTIAYIWLPAPAYGLPAGASTLGSLPAFARSGALHINNAGVVIGIAWNSGNPFEPLNNSTRGFVWRHGQLDAVNTMIPASPTWNVRTLWDVNQRGQIVGLGVRSGLRRGVLLTECTGDLDGNFLVDLDDLLLVLGAFDTGPAGDVDSDGDTDLDDVLLMLGVIGESCL